MDDIGGQMLVDGCLWTDICRRCWWAKGAKRTELDETGRTSNEIVMDDNGDGR